ncbi:MAG: class II aldolase/adducin family protein [Veillonellales bacterium]
MNGYSEIKSEILAAGIALLKKNLVTGTWGNLSSRVPESDLLAITPSGRDYRKLQNDDIVIVDRNGLTVQGHLKPSSELPLHLAIYKARQDVQAIVHTHSVFASACAVARRAIPPIIEDLVQVTGGSVEVAEYALPGTAELARNVVTALGNRSAALLANHGVVCCARSVTEAMTACELVEKAAEIYLYAQQLGGAVALNQQDVATMHEFYVKHYRKLQGDDE